MVGLARYVHIIAFEAALRGRIPRQLRCPGNRLSLTSVIRNWGIVRFFQGRILTPSATGYYEVAAQARPMMMLAETCIIGGTMDGYSHLSIAESEDVMVRWKGHEGVSQIAGSSTGTSRPYPARSGGTAGRALQDAATARLRHRAGRTAGGCAAGAPGSWTSPRGARRPW